MKENQKTWAEIQAERAAMDWDARRKEGISTQNVDGIHTLLTEDEFRQYRKHVEEREALKKAEEERIAVYEASFEGISLRASTLQNRTVHTEECAERVVGLLEEGMLLSDVCMLEGSPSYATVMKWCRRSPEFSEKVKFARTVGYDLLAEDCIRTAREPFKSQEVVDDEFPNGNIKSVKRKTFDNVNRAKLKIETSLRLLAKWDPRYADVAKNLDASSAAGNSVKAIEVSIVEPLAEQMKKNNAVSYDVKKTH